MREYETERLRLRRPRAGDAAHLADMNADPEVMRYIGPVARSRAEALASAEAWLGRPGDGAGLVWIIEDASAGEFHGWAGLLPFDGGRETELGYRLRHAAWGRGIASEAARPVVAHGFSALGDGLGLDRLVAVAHAGNRTSHRVLEKLGFRLRGRRAAYGVAGLLYFVLERPAD